MAGSRRLTGLSDDVLAAVGEQLPDGPLVVALSGGADSAVCAWAVSQLRSGVRALHVDHGWPASTALRHSAQEVARHLGIDLAVSNYFGELSVTWSYVLVGVLVPLAGFLFIYHYVLRRFLKLERIFHY